ncbi:unnamed protein product [Cylicocyclus nassatus]|uniref:RNA helicase n=1 Tax=Cylicocyclus nassatus TaxID=53992 RepID=A0AA36M1J2_CYLNA|nr:unnamed protein product [Cylicocyclus nassatus]
MYLIRIHSLWQTTDCCRQVSNRAGTRLYSSQCGIEVKGNKCPKPIKTWAQCGVEFKILQQLKKHNFAKPPPIQAQAIPCIMAGPDLIGEFDIWEALERALFHYRFGRWRLEFYNCYLMTQTVSKVFEKTCAEYDDGRKAIEDGQEEIRREKMPKTALRSEEDARKKKENALGTIQKIPF